MDVAYKELGYCFESVYYYCTDEILQILNMSLTDTEPLQDLFGKTKFNNVNELNGSCEPSLFKF